MPSARCSPPLELPASLSEPAFLCMHPLTNPTDFSRLITSMPSLGWGGFSGSLQLRHLSLLTGHVLTTLQSPSSCCQTAGNGGSQGAWGGGCCQQGLPRPCLIRHTPRCAAHPAALGGGGLEAGEHCFSFRDGAELY